MGELKLKESVAPIGLPMWLDPADGGIGPALYHYDTGRELAFMSILDETVREGMVCIDIGANVGYTTLAMLKNVGQDGFVYAIEPSPQNIDTLRKNVEYNRFSNICSVSQCVISDRSGIIDFWLSVHPNLSSVHKTDKSTEKIGVESYTLGVFLSGRLYPNFIKMDVEGHEVEIFRGALDYFTENRGETYILVECHPYVGNPQCDDPTRDFSQILSKFFDIGFDSIYLVTGCFAHPEKIMDFGYRPSRVVHTDGFERGIFEGISNQDLVYFACKEPQVARSIMIGRDE